VIWEWRFAHAGFAYAQAMVSKEGSFKTARIWRIPSVDRVFGFAAGAIRWRLPRSSTG
jgi:hypothetical protein